MREACRKRYLAAPAHGTMTPWSRRQPTRTESQRHNWGGRAPRRPSNRSRGKSWASRFVSARTPHWPDALHVCLRRPGGREHSIWMSVDNETTHATDKGTAAQAASHHIEVMARPSANPDAYACGDDVRGLWDDGPTSSHVALDGGASGPILHRHTIAQHQNSANGYGGEHPQHNEALPGAASCWDRGCCTRRPCSVASTVVPRAAAPCRPYSASAAAAHLPAAHRRPYSASPSPYSLAPNALQPDRRSSAAELYAPPPAKPRRPCSASAMSSCGERVRELAMQYARDQTVSTQLPQACDDRNRQVSAAAAATRPQSAPSLSRKVQRMLLQRDTMPIPAVTAPFAKPFASTNGLRSELTVQPPPKMPAQRPCSESTLRVASHNVSAPSSSAWSRQTSERPAPQSISSAARLRPSKTRSTPGSALCSVQSQPCLRGSRIVSLAKAAMRPHSPSQVSLAACPDSALGLGHSAERSCLGWTFADVGPLCEKSPGSEGNGGSCAGDATTSTPLSLGADYGARKCASGEHHGATDVTSAAHANAGQSATDRATFPISGRRVARGTEMSRNILGGAASSVHRADRPWLQRQPWKLVSDWHTDAEKAALARVGSSAAHRALTNPQGSSACLGSLDSKSGAMHCRCASNAASRSLPARHAACAPRGAMVGAVVSSVPLVQGYTMV